MSAGQVIAYAVLCTACFVSGILVGRWTDRAEWLQRSHALQDFIHLQLKKVVAEMPGRMKPCDAVLGDLRCTMPEGHNEDHVSETAGIQWPRQQDNAFVPHFVLCDTRFGNYHCSKGRGHTGAHTMTP